MLFRYLRESFARKKARRIFSEYTYKVDSFHLQEEGTIQFANWENPLVRKKEITQSEINFFKQFIPKGSLAIDIGTNIGDTTVPMAVAAGKEGLVLGFDPNPYIYKILSANAGLNKEKTNIVALPFAISDEDAEFYYGSSEASYSNGGITKEKNNHHGSFHLPQKVKGVNLLKYLESNYAAWLPKLSFVKIDTEGLDKEIIRSITHLLKQYKPVIVSECFGPLSAEEKEEQYNIVADLGYEMFYFHDFEQGTNTRPITKASDMSGYPQTINFYAKVKK